MAAADVEHSSIASVLYGLDGKSFVKVLLTGRTSGQCFVALIGHLRSLITPLGNRKQTEDFQD